MRPALMSASFIGREWGEALDLGKEAGITLVEGCSGGYIPKRHFDARRLLDDGNELRAFEDSLRSRGMELFALSCHGNPLHPAGDVADAADEDFRATCELAARLGVDKVNVLAGCPGGAPGDQAPNWIIPSVVPDLRSEYAWQWEQRVVPYWSAAAEFADRHGVKVCVEPHPQTVVYNAESFERLRGAVGPVIGMNYDHSHLWWQGIQPRQFIERCADAIYTVHIKDTALDEAKVAALGVISAADYDAMDERPWTYGTPGFGHGDQVWGELLLALHKAGYQGPLSIECEDPFIDPVDGLRYAADLLDRLAPRRQLPDMNWPSQA